MTFLYIQVHNLADELKQIFLISYNIIKILTKERRIMLREYNLYLIMSYHTQKLHYFLRLFNYFFKNYSK